MEHLSLDQQILRTMPISYSLLSSRSPQRDEVLCQRLCLLGDVHLAKGGIEPPSVEASRWYSTIHFL